MLHSYRITKYNPENRNEKWFYNIVNEWTSIYDFKDNNINQYIEIEDMYIETVKKFMEINKINFLTIKNYEKKDDYKDIKFKLWINKQNYEIIKNNIIISINEIPTLIRLVLRENIWCKLSWNRNFFVHFWYDLYMYIWFRHSKKIEEKIKNLHIDNIYIEEFRSPYLR